MSFLKDKYLAITIGEVELDIGRKTVPASTTAGTKNTYEMGVIRPAEGYQLTLDKSTVTNFSPDLGSVFPSGLTIDIKNALVAWDIEKTGSATGTSTDQILGVNFGIDIDLSDLPIAGKMFPKGETLRIENLQILVAKNALSTMPAKAMNSIVPDDVAALPPTIRHGLNLAATLKLAGETLTLSTSSISHAQGATSNSGFSSQPTHHSKGNVNKTFGPVHIQSVNLGFTGGDLTVTIDASIKFGPLTLGFYELQIGSPINEFDPEFNLKGLTLDYHKSDITVAGAFLNQGGGEYSGMFELALTKLQLSAIGSYKNDNGNPSLFIYGLLNEPLGGPAFFFVEGVAAAFGYNRNFIAPPVTAISSFPLVAAAFSNSPTPPSTSDLADMMTELDEYIPPKLGEYFMGLGIKFMSFKVINSFALLIVKFGDELEFDLLGESTYVAPNPHDPNPIATVQLELVGSYKPALGTLLIRGQLTPNSFVLSKKCHLEGGFALANWFSPSPYHGDFVYSFGGYGNHYTPPTHYPQNIPQLGFLWQVAPDISIKGGGYWVINPHKVILGGYLLAAYSTSEVRASFEIDAYFSLDWSPLHYHASFSVTFSLSIYIDVLFISGWIGFELSEGLEIHGPPFGGTAYIDLAVATVHINFGASPQPKPLLTGPQFTQAFLPENPSDKILSINIESGLIKTEKDATGHEIHFINPKELTINTDSFVPCTSFSGTTNGSDGNAFEITPMGVVFDGSTNSSTHTVTITKKGKSTPSTQFSIVTSPTKQAPASMWKNTDSADITDHGLLSPLSFGTTITPNTTISEGSSTGFVKRSALAKEQFNGKPFKWQTINAFDGSLQKPGQYADKTIDESTFTYLDEVFDFGIKEEYNHAGLGQRLANISNDIYVGSLATQND